MACSSSCPNPGSHQSWGECVRAKNLEVAPVEAHKFNQFRKRELDGYVNARNAGLQPETVFKKDVDKAWKITEATGVPYRADAS